MQWTLEDSIVGLQGKLNRNGTSEAGTVAIVTVRSNRQCLRVLIESLLSITRGVWTTAETGIEENEDEGGQNPVGVCG